MKITYHKGPNDNVYCKIITNRGKKIYDIDGIPKRGRLDRDDRFDLYLQIIARNPGISHTHLIFLAQKLGYDPAKRTIEQDLDYFEKIGHLESEKDGDHVNAIRRWSIKAPEHEFEIHAKKAAKDLIKSLEVYISKIEKNYESFNAAKKSWAMAHLLDILHIYQPTIEVINQETKIKKEKRHFDLLVKRAYNILWKEKRDYIDGRPILRRLLQLKSSKPMMNMEKFLEEIK